MLITETLSRVVTLAVMALTWCGCGQGIRAWEPINDSAVPRFGDYPDAGAALALDQQSVRFHEAGGRAVADRTITRHGRVFSDAGRDLLITRIFYRSGLSELMSLRARVRRPDGRTDHFGIHDAVDAAAWPAWILYSDDRVVILDLSYAPNGSYVEIETVVRHHEPRLFQFSHALASRWPTAKSRFSVSAPADWTLAWELRTAGHPTALQPPDRTSGGQRRVNVQRTRVPALSTEPYGPDAATTAETVAVQLREWTEPGFDGPEALSRWLYQLAQPAAEGAPQLDALAHRVSGTGAPRQRATRLYQWVQREVSYCAIEVGLGAWRPHSAREVESLRYGDCKDKANLLHVLLKAIGVPSRLAAIWLHHGLPRPFGLPTVNGNFNHMILLVDLPEGVVFADPTASNVTFGSLPAAAQDAPVLPLTAHGSALIRSPGSALLSNTIAESYALAVTADALEGTLRLTARGTEATQMADRFDELGATPRVLADRVALPHASIERIARSESTYSAVVRHPFPGGEAPRIFRLSDHFQTGLPELAATRRRQTPVLLGPRRSHQLRVTLADTCLSSVPPPWTSQTQWVSYKLSWSDPCTMERIWTIRTPLVPASDFGPLKEQLDQLRRVEAQPFRMGSLPR